MQEKVLFLEFDNAWKITISSKWFEFLIFYFYTHIIFKMRKKIIVLNCYAFQQLLPGRMTNSRSIKLHEHVYMSPWNKDKNIFWNCSYSKI